MPVGPVVDEGGEPVRTPRVGGSPTSPGGGGPGGSFGFGGGAGGILSRAPVAGSSLDNLRAMLRKRFVGSGAPGYATPAAPAAPAPADPAAAAVGGLQPFQSMPAPGMDLASWGRPVGGRPGAPPPAAPPAPSPGPVSTAAPPTPGTTWGDINQSGGNVPHDVNFGAGFLGTLSDMLRNFLGSGAFSDRPNQGSLDAARSNALSDAGAARSHNELLAQSLRADPATAASSALQASLGSQGDVAKAVSGASLGELTHQRNFGQDLLETLLGRQGAQNQYNPNQAPWGAIIQALGSLGKP